jgi:glycosyltransferase involved in cell wall biosynthesis
MSLQNSKELFCISKNVKDRLLKYYRVEAKVRYLFIDASKFRFESFGKYFLCVSRINEGKRQHLALEAFKLFHQKNKNFKLVIAGAIDGNDRSRRYYENLVKEAIGYPVDFVISPMNEDIKNLYANCYSVLFTAENEDLGLVPLESMASSKPVIAINEGGQKETIVNEVTGFLVGDVLEMVGKMIYLAENLERTQEMGTNGRKHVEREFSKTTFFENLDPIIRTHSKL